VGSTAGGVGGTVAEAPEATTGVGDDTTGAGEATAGAEDAVDAMEGEATRPFLQVAL
jgi:hypothetical protein